MAASKASHIIVWKKSSQVYATASLETALKTPIPKGCGPEDKRILLLSYLPDDEELRVYPLTEEQIEEKMNELREKEALKLAKKEEEAAEAASTEDTEDEEDEEDE